MRYVSPLGEFPKSESAISSRDACKIHNGYIFNDGLRKGITKRPGYVSYSDDSATNPTRSEIFAPFIDSSGNVWWVDSALSVWKNAVEGSTATNLYTKDGVTWAEDETYVYLHGGAPSGGTTNSDYRITKSTAGLTEITDADMPIKVASTEVVPGVVQLDGYICIAANVGVDSRIYNSDLGSMTAWTSTNFIAAQLESDKLVYLAKHKNHIVAFGQGSIEFFYNAGNPTGSPLSRRSDIFYKVGLVSQTLAETEKSSKSMVASYGDTLFFVGKPQGGAVGIYALDGFKLERISTPAIDYLLLDNGDTVIRGIVTYKNKAFLIVQDNWSNSYSLVYDISDNIWYHWTVTYQRGAVSGIGSSKVVVGTSPIVSSISGIGDDTSTNPAFTIITPKIDNVSAKQDTSHLRKFCSQLAVSSDNPGSTTNISISYTDDDYQTYSTARTLDINKYDSKLTGLGSFYERAFKLSYTGANNLKLYSLILDLDLGMK